MSGPLFTRGAKTVIGMAHVGALPGSPGFDAGGGMAKLLDGVLADVAKLEAGGVDAIMFGNENDRPYVLQAPPEGIAALAAVVAAASATLSVPFGVDYLWDPVASVAIGAATAPPSCGKSSRAPSPPTWAAGNRTAPAPSVCASRWVVPT